jgi:hypothetical protein
MPKPGCAPWYDGFPAELAAFAPDVVAVVTGPFDLADRRLPGSGRWAGPDDDAVMANLVDSLAEARAVIVAGPWEVAWLLPPGYSPPSGQGLGDPAFELSRLVVLHQALRAAGSDDRVVDLGPFFASCPDGLADRVVRPDGIHVSEAAAGTVAGWLGPLLVADDPGGSAGGADCASLLARSGL